MRRALFGLALVLAAGGCGKKDPAKDGKKTVTIWWAQWAPADGLQELAKEYEKETGVKVTVFQIPWPAYQTEVFKEFGKKQTSFDIVVGDSQWIGRGATKGLYVDLTDWIKGAVDMNTVHPRAAKYLCEYPGGSGRYYAAPCETDAMGIAYRKDWFEDAAEKEAFKKKYGRELAVPDTWEELRDIAEHFTRPEKKQFGWAILTGRGYDALVMGFQQFLYAWGGSWGDEKSYKVAGHLNSAQAVEALVFFKDLLKFAPPGGESLDYGQVMEPFKNGTAAMSSNYFGFYPSISVEMGEKAGFFKMPRKGDRRVATLGGQGMSVSAKTTPAQQDLARKFIAWFLQKKIQDEWIKKPAGFTANTAILGSEEFRKATPYNRAFAESLDYLVDFWNVPIYNELLTPATMFLAEALDGKKSPQQALDALAAEHEKIFREAGLLK